MFRMIAAGAALLFGAAAIAQEPPGPAGGVDYSAEDTWLCLPGRADTCAMPLPTTALNANGYGSTGQAVPAANPAIDCFYVYPTVSRDPTLNSDMEAGLEEKAAAMVQFARFGGTCRTFAPMYRQVTLAGLAALFTAGARAGDQDLAYRDVRNAWRTYIRDHNKGRPYVLIGHSQGTVHLSKLIAEEIESKPEAARMLSALLLGFNIEVPEGQVVGGTFKQTPLCTSAGQTGCIVTYVSYRATNPPPANALFGRAVTPGMTIACTNPARLSGGAAPLDSYWYAGPSASGAATTIAWSSQGAPPTPFLRTEGLVSASCVNRGNAGYLSVLVDADPADARTDAIYGDVSVAGRLQPGWGLHLADMNLTQGDLIALVEAQAGAFARKN